ncbi:gamma-glutamylcyclotransferase family protein [uncultured Alcanivorax sp.]|uniref:gamma-glutamylcyclotransferase family protein n=1 Tax=uncultured Alcanivorax sp. TaxID=191215 RepID=UPI0032B18016
MALPMLVFVYGTLKRGGRNQGFLRRARFVASWQTAPAYQLFDLGTYPGAWRPGTTALQGELYEVDALILAALDRLEEVPRVYRRESIQTDFGPAILYLLQRMPRSARRCASGRWP